VEGNVGELIIIGGREEIIRGLNIIGGRDELRCVRSTAYSSTSYSSISPIYDKWSSSLELVLILILIGIVGGSLSQLYTPLSIITPNVWVSAVSILFNMFLECTNI